MASADLLMELFPRTPDALSDGDVLTSFLTEVVRRDYLVLPAAYAFALVEELGATGAWKPGIMDEAQLALGAYIAGASDTFECYLRYCPPPGADYGLLFGMTIHRDVTILIGVNDGTFKYNELGLSNYESFIAFVSLVYQTWPLLYGYLSDGPAWSREEVLGLKANALYELTIFGPEYVTHIGRDRFSSLDVWRQIPMSDGGRILAVGLYARYTDPTVAVHPRAAADRLGLDGPDFMQ